MTMEGRGDARQNLARDGYLLFQRLGARGLVPLLEELGRVLHVEEVVVAPESGSLVKSERELSLHTDHHRADVIVWHCLAQSDEGGETILADAHSALVTLASEQRDALTRVELKEHSVFCGDVERHPLVTVGDGRVRVYYSYWMAESLVDPIGRAAFEAFARAVEIGPKVTLRLTPGDVLAIDNGRMLHGRAAILGSKERHLRRYWLEAPLG